MIILIKDRAPLYMSVSLYELFIMLIHNMKLLRYFKSSFEFQSNLK